MESGPQPRTSWHARRPEEALAALASSRAGLGEAEARRRLAEGGPNELPAPPRDGPFRLYLAQFRSPLIYLLVAAAGVSAFLGEPGDAIFIFLVLQVNAVIGTLQGWRAESAAAALDAMVEVRCTVRRDGRLCEVAARELVPGDVVQLESGASVPADLRLIDGRELLVDESLLTGESEPVFKEALAAVPEGEGLAGRLTMLHAGTAVLAGRATGVVAETGQGTQIGRIAGALGRRDAPPPPLLVHLERFSRVLGAAMVAVIALVAAVLVAGGHDLVQVFLIAVALVVAAIPEGLPVAITVALTVATGRMARRRVIVRALPAVEGLGAATVIASDKTGTLTVNSLTAKRAVLPDGRVAEICGEGLDLEGGLEVDGAAADRAAREMLTALAAAGALANEGTLVLDEAGTQALGDTVDVAFLVFARKLGVEPQADPRHHGRAGDVPYEPKRRFGASFHRDGAAVTACVKGAAEAVLPMCAEPCETAVARAAALAAEGYRVLAVAEGPVASADAAALGDLRLVGFLGLIDPLRPEAAEAVAACQAAGIDVRMVTGDHPATALAIARQLGIASCEAEVVTGSDLTAGADARRAKVFARVEPLQKLDIVEALRASGEVVVVTGDGVNDAPALQAADIGVAMGRSGTDVARQAADLIVTDDNFSSIVAGVEEGRIAYDNIRKVIWLLVSTGMAEIVLFLIAIGAGLPPPLLAVQLLWLNLVTNGIQHVALAFERGEPDTMRRPPRPPNAPIFDRRMVEQTAVVGVVMGAIAFLVFERALAAGMEVEAARNLVLLLMVLFENVHVFNCRSERRSILAVPFLSNPLVLAAVLGTQGVHLLAMHLPWTASLLHLQPVPAGAWPVVLGLSLLLLLAVEAYKLARRTGRG